MNGFRWQLRMAILIVVAAGFATAGCLAPRTAPPSPPPPEVSVTQPIPYPVQIYFQYNGNLDAIEVVNIVARVEGFLQEIAFTEGNEVWKDDLLFKIDPREYEAEVKKAVADQRKANSELKLARSEEERVKSLRSTGVVSQEDYELRMSARETGEAVVMQTEAAQEAAELKLDYTEIRAPIDGLISRTLVTRGNLVGQNQSTLLTTIVSMDPLYVYFDVPEIDLIEYQRTMSEEQRDDLLNRSIPVELGVASEVGYPHLGKIDFRENRVDVGTGTVRIRGRIPNPKLPPADVRRLYPGLYARIRVPSGTPRMLMAIPEDALMTGQEGRFVYVVGENNLIEKRSVTIGPQIFKGPLADDGAPRWLLEPLDTNPHAFEDVATNAMQVPSVVAIVNGLTTDDVIVINGLTKARPGFAVAPKRHALIPPPTPAEAN